MSQFETLPIVLEASISPNSVVIKQAEEQLKNFAQTPGYAQGLITLIAQGNVGSEIKIAGAVAFKNFVRQNWNPEASNAPLPQEERSQIRQLVIEALFQLDDVYRRQLSQALCIIGQHDFPHNWPELMDILAQRLSGDFVQMSVALTAIEQLVHRYRKVGRSDELIREIIVVLRAIARPITDLFENMIQVVPEPGNDPNLSAEQQHQWLDVLYLLTRIYYSLIWQDLPEFFEDHLEQWMNGFAKLLPLKLIHIEHAADDNEPSTQDNIKKTICDITKLFSQRFEEEFGPYIIKFIGIVWTLLVETDHRVRYDPMVNAGLGFLSAVSERDRYKTIFQEPGVLQQCCEQVVIRNLTLRHEDIEQFEDEPFDYLKKDVEGLDLETRRRGAVEFVRALIKHFENEVFHILSLTIQNYLEEFNQNPAQNWVKKDVVYYLVSALASKATTARQGATAVSSLINIHDFYNQYVRPELLQSDANTYFPILIADALNFVVLFRNQLNADVIVEAFGRPEAPVRRILASNRLVLHHYVGYAFDKLATVKRDNKLIFSPETIPSHDYLVALIDCLQKPDTQKSHYLMKAFLRCLHNMDRQQTENATMYVNVLIQLLQANMRECQNAMFIHLIFESLCVIIKKSFPFIQDAVNEQIMPIVEQIIVADLTDFIPYSLQLVALLLYQSETEKQLGRSNTGYEKYESFFPHLLKGSFWQRTANAPALLTIFEAFLKTASDFVLKSGNIEGVMGCYQNLIVSRNLEEHGFRLATALAPFYDTNEILTMRGILLPMLNRYQSNKTGKYTRYFVLFLCRLAYLRGAERFIHVLNEIQSGMASMVVDKIILKELKENHLAQNFDDKRHLVLGLASIIGDAYDQIKPLFPDLVQTAVNIMDSTTASAAAFEQPEDIDQDNPDVYCRLININSEPIIPTNINVKQHLTQAVSKIIQVDQTALACLSQQVQQSLNQFAQN